MEKIKSIDKTIKSNNRREALLQKLMDDYLSTFAPNARDYDSVELYGIIYNLFRGKYDFSYNDYKWVVKQLLTKNTNKSTTEIISNKFPFVEGGHYQTKFAANTWVTVTKFVERKDGKAVRDCLVIYDNATHLGACPLPIERLKG